MLLKKVRNIIVKKRLSILMLFTVVIGISISIILMDYMSNASNEIVFKESKIQRTNTVNIKSVKNTLPSVYTSKAGKIIMNDIPFFPFGFYHDSQASYDWTTTNAMRLKHLREIAEAGFNTIHPQIGGNYESDLDFLEEAQKLGINVIPNFSYDSRLEIINKYKNQAAIIGWDIADDVDNPVNGFTPDVIRKWHNEVKGIDPNRFTYISGGFPDKIEAFLNSADIVGFQSYPVDNDPNSKNPLRDNHYTIQPLTENEAGIPQNRPIIANLQAFPWQNQSPTGKEVRNMTYSALINGVDGILYYSFFFDGWELSQQKGLWNEMKSLAKEINQLQPILLQGSLTTINSGVNDLYASQWTFGNNVYYVILSTSTDQVIEVSINLPIQVKGIAEPLFAERPSGLILQDGQFKGSIQPGDVHVYKISQ
jgi:hypothetical protein